MSDVFISYARPAEAQAKRIAEALRSLGYGVWRDDELPAHRDYSEVIEERLRAARAVVVVWSAEAVKSQWVRAEADLAREAGTLVQLSLDGAALPMPFNRIQCADLTGWTGDLAAPGWRKVVASVSDLLGERPQPQGRSIPTPAVAHEPLLAVLAFDNLSGDAETAYFSDGVSEEILQTVARGADLKVIGRASSFLFRGADKRAAHVAAELKATHVLDGSVRRAGSKVRIAANLIECAHETTLWSDRYDRELSDVFALQDEIATSVAAALKTAFAKPQPAPSIDPGAHDLFLRAQAYEGFGFEGTNRRLAMLEEVVARAPSFARGWATLALRKAIALKFHPDEAVAAGVTRDQVLEAAQTALRIDPDMGLAYQALGWLEPSAAYRNREELVERALAASPHDAAVLSSAGAFYGIVGRLREGLSFARRAYELDPLEPEVANVLAIHLLLAGRIDESGRVYDAALARWLESESVVANTIASHARRGNRAKVEALIDKWSAAAAANAMLRNSIWFARNLLDPDPAAIRRLLEEQQREVARTGVAPVGAALRLHALGMTEETYKLLDKGSFAFMFDREAAAPPLSQYPGAIFGRYNKAFFQDLRFPRLCAKLGLADYWVETSKWPDCADEVAYDFRAEVRRLAGADRPTFEQR